MWALGLHGITGRAGKASLQGICRLGAWTPQGASSWVERSHLPTEDAPEPPIPTHLQRRRYRFPPASPAAVSWHQVEEMDHQAAGPEISFLTRLPHFLAAPFHRPLSSFWASMSSFAAWGQGGVQKPFLKQR